MSLWSGGKARIAIESLNKTIVAAWSSVIFCSESAVDLSLFISFWDEMFEQETNVMQAKVYAMVFFI